MRVEAKTVAADDVVTLELVAQDAGRLKDWTPGSHIDLVLPNGAVRQYSLCGDRWDTTRYRVAVLRETSGRGGSAFVHDELEVGDLVGVGGPRNNFALVPAEDYLFIAGGIGITPLLPMIRQAEFLGIPWSLLYGGRHRGSMAFLDELASYGDCVQVRPQDEFGLLDLSAFVGKPREEARVYVCGPEPLLAAAESACRQWPRYSLRTERFVARAAAPTRTTSFVVELARSGQTVDVPPGTSIVDAIARAGADVLTSCGQGTCGTCGTPVILGRPEHLDSILEDHEREASDFMFPCVSRSLDDRLVLDL